MSLICGRCEKPLEGHDGGACRRKMSRRWFLGALGGAAAALVAKKRIPTGGLFDPKADVARQFRTGDFGKYHPDAFTFEWPRLDIYPRRKPGDRFTIAGVNAVNPEDHLTVFTVQKAMDSTDAECILTVSPRMMGIWR